MTPELSTSVDAAADTGAPTSVEAAPSDGGLVAPHVATDPDLLARPLRDDLPTRAPKRWVPRRVLVTPAALDWPHGQAVVDRAEAAGAEVVRLKANRLTGLRGRDERETYTLSKSTLAVVVSPPSKRRLQPIPPSADWQFHLAEGCPAHCQYCYLAGSLSGPPVTRVYANLPEILDGLAAYEGSGSVTSADPARAAEGTTFEASCYTDPLALEHLTGSLAETIRYFGTRDAVQLRWTTKYDAVDPLLALPHRGRTRIRFSVNALPVTTRFEGGTAALTERLAAMRRAALAGYPVGLTIAPIMPMAAWQDRYGELLELAATAVAGVPGLDLTAECITHRFTPGSRETLLDWYPRTKLEMDAAQRSQKRTKFGSVKYVYTRPVMTELREWFTAALAERLPQARLLYWT